MCIRDRFIRDLFKAGMNVVRMNTAHASREGFEKLITNVREVSNRIAILLSLIHIYNGRPGTDGLLRRNIAWRSFQ